MAGSNDDRNFDAEPTLADMPAAERMAGVGYTPSERELLSEFVSDELPDLHKRIAALSLDNHVGPAEVFRVAPVAGVPARKPGAADNRGGGDAARAGAGPRGGGAREAKDTARRGAAAEREREPGGTAAIDRERSSAGAPLANDEYLAFAPAWRQAAWIAQGAITSRQLVELYRSRLERYAPHLLCMATECFDRAAAEAAAVDKAAAVGGAVGGAAAGNNGTAAVDDAGPGTSGMAAVSAAGGDAAELGNGIAGGGNAATESPGGGPLRGTVWGAKDLLDTNGIETAWGAEPYQGRTPDKDAHVVARLRSAGTALIAKLSLGALAYGDIWYGGRTKNPWNTERGSSGSSAGSASATAAGLVSFALGTETLGSIVSPSMECGTTGLRPTFGLVGRSGAMALSWSFDKIGPITRTVKDAGLALEAIAGPDPDDASSVGVGFAYSPTRRLESVRVGYDPRWFDSESANDLDRSIPKHLEELGATMSQFTLPELDYQLLAVLLQVDAAAAFEELTRTGRDDELSWQAKDAWPSRFRGLRFVSAVEYVQLQRLRRRVGDVMHGVFSDVDVIVSPSFVGPMLFITNATGHPSLTLRIGFKEGDLPHGITLYGRHFAENALLGLGEALEGKLQVWDKRPPL